LELLITLDDPWNARECDIYNNRQAEHAVTLRPDRPDSTTGQDDNRADCLGCPESLSSTSFA
jgi:hypothetical protein